MLGIIDSCTIHYEESIRTCTAFVGIAKTTGYIRRQMQTRYAWGSVKYKWNAARAFMSIFLVNVLAEELNNMHIEMAVPYSAVPFFVFGS